MKTPRYKIGQIADISAENCSDMAKMSLFASNNLDKIRFDLRELTPEEGIEFIDNYMELIKKVKKCWMLTKREAEDIISNLDWLLQRCSQDKAKCRRRIERRDNEE